MEILPLFRLHKFEFYHNDPPPSYEEDSSISVDRIRCWTYTFMQEGMRTRVEGVLLVHEHRHPHLILIQVENTFHKLPGGRLMPGENEIEGLKRILTSKLGDDSPSFQTNCQIGECVAVWWRSYFEDAMYPYYLPNVTYPKECRKLFMVHLSEGTKITVSHKHKKLLAVPLFELHNKMHRYGQVISSIPKQLSRFQFMFMP